MKLSAETSEAWIGPLGALGSMPPSRAWMWT